MGRADVDATISELAASQQLLFSRAQVAGAGGDDALIARRLRSARWLRVLPGVYSLPGWRPTWHRRLWAAHLGQGPESTVSFDSAAALEHFDGFPVGPVILTVAHPSNPRRHGADFVHQINDVAPHHRCRIDGLPVTTPARTLVDLSRTASRARLRAAFEREVLRTSGRLLQVERVLLDVARPGKPGLLPIGALVDEMASGEIPAESELERLLFAAVEAAGVPAPRRQFPFPGRDPRPGRVDAAFPDAQLILEADGRRWHGRLRDLNRDHWRDQEAARRGWQTLRFLHAELTSDRADVAAAIAETYEVRLAQLRPAG